MFESSFASTLRRSRSIAMAALVVAGISLVITACSRRDSVVESNPKMYGLHDRVPEGGGVRKVGNRYQAQGQWFTPRVDPNYDRVGVASWYGEYFHGRKTANGEWYDMNRISAAHPTLPMPTYARVTNLENGRTLVVRINDRGPFAKGREIDLSKRAAEVLGFQKAGTARVRVTYLTDAPLEGDVADLQNIDRPGRMPFFTASTGSDRRAPVIDGTSAQVAASAPAAPVTTGTLARQHRPVFRNSRATRTPPVPTSIGPLAF